MGEEAGGRRERRKAQTRAEIRAAAQRLFAAHGFDAVTISDIAAAADVAVQTVFNHFETKESLFFDGRTPWLEGAAAAVTERTRGTDPVTALAGYLQSYLPQLLDLESRPEHRCLLEALRCSASLQARERTLVEQAGGRVAAALTAAIADGDWPAVPFSDPATAQLLSRLVADLFLAAGRVLVLENRRCVLSSEHPKPRRPSLQVTMAATLTALDRCARELAGSLPAAAPEQRADLSARCDPVPDR